MDDQRYEAWREEKENTIRLISNCADEIIAALHEIEENQKEPNSVLPYYDFLIDTLMMGESMNKELTHKYFDAFSKSISYKHKQLSYAIQSLTIDSSELGKVLYGLSPWYQKLWIRIKRWVIFRRKICEK